MKKYLIVWILVSSILLGSCSSVNSRKIDELEKQVTGMKKEKEDDLFKKKQECALYTKEETESIIKDINWIYSDEFEIFYSKTKNSCIKALKRDFHTFKTLRIDNILTNENIILCKSNIDNNCEKEYNQKIKELKWE